MTRSRKRKTGKQGLDAIPSKLVSLARWDMGASGPANQVGLIVESRGFTDVETGETRNPNNVTGARRLDRLEYYHKRGLLDHRQHEAGKALRNAFEATQRTPPAIKEINVDSSPKPDANIALTIGRISKYTAIAGYIPRASVDVVKAVALDGNSVSSMPRYSGNKCRKGMVALRNGLTAVADKMGY